MAHLPIEINQLVYPFLRSIGRDYYNSNGNSLRVFDILEDVGIVDHDDDDELLLDNLMHYHWWFLSSDEFDWKFYKYIYEQIPYFNASQNLYDLHLQSEITSHNRLLRTDSDAHGSYNFLIYVTNKKNNAPIHYTLPVSMKNRIEKLYKDREFQNPIKWITDKKYSEINQQFRKYIHYDYAIDTEDLRKKYYDENYDFDKYPYVLKVNISDYDKYPYVHNINISEAIKFLEKVANNNEFPKLIPYVKPSKNLQDYLDELLSMKPTDPKFTELWNKMQVLTNKNNLI